MCEIVNVHSGFLQGIATGTNARATTVHREYIAKSKRHEAKNANLGSCRFINETLCLVGASVHHTEYIVPPHKDNVKEKSYEIEN